MDLSKSKITKKDFNELMTMVVNGCKELYEIFKKGIYDSVSKRRDIM